MSRAIVALYRVRGLIYLVAGAVLIANVLLGSLLEDALGPVRGVVSLLAVVAVLFCLVLIRIGPKFLPQHEVKVVGAPVRGRWTGVNSPATKVPSHGLRAYGQAYAIDLVHEPADASRPTFGDGPAMRANEDYPAFGQPVFAMFSGTVVDASDWRRDHRARSNAWSLMYMFAEGMIREIGGPGFILGNHVVIRSDDGVFAAVAHLQRGSVSVQVGDKVGRGDQIGRCGNSGNSSEPHVHAQLMDRRSLLTAQGLPMAFAGVTLADGPQTVDALPANEEHMSG